jgi:hypothetical protein
MPGSYGDLNQARRTRILRSVFDVLPERLLVTSSPSVNDVPGVRRTLSRCLQPRQSRCSPAGG